MDCNNSNMSIMLNIVRQHLAHPAMTEPVRIHLKEIEEHLEQVGCHRGSSEELQVIEAVERLTSGLRSTVGDDGAMIMPTSVPKYPWDVEAPVEELQDVAEADDVVDSYALSDQENGALPDNTSYDGFVQSNLVRGNNVQRWDNQETAYEEDLTPADTDSAYTEPGNADPGNIEYDGYTGATDTERSDRETDPTGPLEYSSPDVYGGARRRRTPRQAHARLPRQKRVTHGGSSSSTEIFACASMAIVMCLSVVGAYA